MKIIDKIINENINLDNTFIFDIETTGLNSKYCKIILIGILYNCQGETVIKQFFAESENEEKDILQAFVDEISRFKSHVTYNGLNFDIPFINYRLKKHNIGFHLNKDDDFDILKFIRPFKNSLKLKDCSLHTIENFFGISRTDTIDGSESINLYKQYVEFKDNSTLDLILLHNYEDIFNLSKLLEIKYLISNKLDTININTNSLNLKIFPKKYKITTKKLIIDYMIFDDKNHNITIYNDNYSILCENDNITVEISINKGIDRDNNEILFYKLSNIIPLKFNDNILEKNIYSLSNFLITNELNNI